MTINASAESDGGVKLIVTDTGCGFDAEEKEKLENPFFRAQPEKYYGIGLGLTMVRNMSDKMGLTITTHGEKEKGARFEVFVPTEMKMQNLSVMGEGSRGRRSILILYIWLMLESMFAPLSSKLECSTYQLDTQLRATLEDIL